MLNERCDIINNTISPIPVIIDDSNPSDTCTTERDKLNYTKMNEQVEICL